MAAAHQNEQYCTVSDSEWAFNRRKAAGSKTISLGLILAIIIVSLFSGFSGPLCRGSFSFRQA